MTRRLKIYPRGTRFWPRRLAESPSANVEMLGSVRPLNNPLPSKPNARLRQPNYKFAYPCTPWPAPQRLGSWNGISTVDAGGVFSSPSICHPGSHICDVLAGAKHTLLDRTSARRRILHQSPFSRTAAAVVDLVRQKAPS